MFLTSLMCFGSVFATSVLCQANDKNNDQSYLHEELRKKANDALLVTLATDLERRLQNEKGDSEKQLMKLKNCVQKSSDSSQYASCILPFLEKGSQAPSKNRSKRQFIDEIKIEPDFATAMKNHELKISQTSTDFVDSSAPIVNYFTDLLKDFKAKNAPWHPNLLPTHIGGKSSIIDSSNLTQNAEDALKNLMQAPMFMLKSIPKENKRKRRSSPANSDNLRFLSPRLFPLFDDSSSSRLLSPDFLSFYDSPNSIASLPALFDGLKPNEKYAWLEFIGEISGASDYLRWMQTEEFKNLFNIYEEMMKNPSTSINQLSSLPNRVLFDNDPRTSSKIEQIIKFDNVSQFLLSLKPEQLKSMNKRGYAFLDRPQLDNLYGSALVLDKRYWPFDMEIYVNSTDDMRLIDVLPTLISSMITDPINRLRKRQTAAGPQFVPPTILAPTVGPPFVNQIFLNSPTILSPAVFTPIINGPLVLSPYILSPYVFSPFIVAPQLLTPFILNPFVLSPDILEPFVLSPNILSPTILSPIILDPYVLSPGILSPTVGSPTILSPLVLSPFILSPSTLTATILSPGVLSPSILSDSDGPTILSPCALCKRKRRRKKR